MGKLIINCFKSQSFDLGFKNTPVLIAVMRRGGATTIGINGLMPLIGNSLQGDYVLK